MKLPGFPHLYKIGLRFPFTVLLLSFLFTVAGAFYSGKLKIETDFSALLPSQKPSVKNFEELKRNFGSLGFLFLTVEHPDLKVAEKFADDLVARVEKMPEVQYVDFRPPEEFFKKRKWLFLEIEDLREMERRIDRSLELEKKGVSPVFSNLMDFADQEDRPDLTFHDIGEKYKEKLKEKTPGIDRGKEGNFLVLRVKSYRGHEDYKANRELLNGIYQIEGELRGNPQWKDVRVGYAGPYINSVETVALVRREMAIVSAVVAGLLMLILFAYFKRVSGVILVGLPLAMGVIWTGCLVYLTLGRVNILTAFGVSILAGLGSDYGIYLLAKFFQEIDRGQNFQKACYQAFWVTGKSTWMAVLTTMAAFGALLFSGFGVFFEFGVVGILGLFLNFLAMMVVLPALLSLAQKYPSHRWVTLFFGWKHKRDFISWEASAWVGRIFSPVRARPVIFAAILLCGVSAFSLPQQTKIHFQEDQLDYKDLPNNQLIRRIQKSTGVSVQQTAILVPGYENGEKLVNQFEDLLGTDEKNRLVFNRVVGISQFVPTQQEEKLILIKRMIPKYLKNRFVNERQKQEFVTSVQETLRGGRVTPENLPQELKRVFLSPKDPNLHAVYVFPAIDRQDNEGMRSYKREIIAIQRSAGVPGMPVDRSFINADILDIIEYEAPRGFIFVLIFSFSILLLSLRNLKRSILIFLHLIGSLIILSGVLYIADIQLNILNIAVFPILLGTGIDCFIHFSHHFDETGNLPETIRADIPSILVSNLTSIIGFGGLIFTSGLGLQLIGWVAVLGLSIMSLFCVFILPRCLSLPFLARERYLEFRPKPAEAFRS